MSGVCLGLSCGCQGLSQGSSGGCQGFVRGIIRGLLGVPLLTKGGSGCHWQLSCACWTCYNCAVKQLKHFLEHVWAGTPAAKAASEKGNQQAETNSAKTAETQRMSAQRQSVQASSHSNCAPEAKFGIGASADPTAAGAAATTVPEGSLPIMCCC